MNRLCEAAPKVLKEKMREEQKGRSRGREEKKNEYLTIFPLFISSQITTPQHKHHHHQQNIPQ